MKELRPTLAGPTEGTRLLQLTKGFVSVVDADVSEWLVQWNWSWRPPGYAKRGTYRDGVQRTVQLHREILHFACVDLEGLDVDHINGNGLDNRRSNLRACSHRQNQLNRKKPATGTTSQYKGVSYSKHAKRWLVRCLVNGRQKNLGYFADELSAHLAYEAAAQANYGEFKRALEH